MAEHGVVLDLLPYTTGEDLMDCQPDGLGNCIERIHRQLTFEFSRRPAAATALRPPPSPNLHEA